MLIILHVRIPARWAHLLTQLARHPPGADFLHDGLRHFLPEPWLTTSCPGHVRGQSRASGASLYTWNCSGIHWDSSKSKVKLRAGLVRSKIRGEGSVPGLCPSICASLAVSGVPRLVHVHHLRLCFRLSCSPCVLSKSECPLFVRTPEAGGYNSTPDACNWCSLAFGQPGDSGHRGRLPGSWWSWFLIAAPACRL